MKKMVLLRHDLPTGEHHFDWLIDPGAGRGLVAFRVAHMLGIDDAAGFEAVRIDDHRRLYLEYEGPISGGRGSVRRVLSGPVVILAEQECQLGLVGELGSWSGAMVGRRVRGDLWWIERLD